MKTHRIHPLIFKAAPAIFAIALALSAKAATNDTAERFPFSVPFELGDAEFSPGDSITILHVRGTKDTISLGGTYCVEGTYSLASRDKADLSLYATTLTRVATPTDPSQIVRIEKGTGSFRLTKTMREDGYLHVTLYSVPSGSGFGGIYFGQGKWVLHHKGFSYLDQHVRSQSPQAAESRAPDQVSLEGPNRALLEYLGDPVPPPADMDPAYTKDGLIKAIHTAAQKAGITVKRVDIEDSEYPFLVGVSCKEGDYVKLTSQIKKMSAYEYNGSVGSGTCNAMNIVPYRAHPGEVSQRIGHRTMLRQQIFFDKLIAMK
jgi:hypothetical protein